MDTGPLMALAALLFLKHLMADGPLQTEWHVVNKGRFMHPAGLAHAGVHVAGTLAAFALWLAVYGVGERGAAGWIAPIALILAGEYVIHYFTDLLKCRVDAHFAWSRVEYDEHGEWSMRIRSTNYFLAFLADQTVHSLTYVLILYLVGEGF